MSYEEIDSGDSLEYAEAEIRKGFVKKVFGILGVQLAVTFAVISFFSLYEPVQKYVDMRNPDAHQWPFVSAMIVSFACILTLACCSNQARVYPNK